MGKERPESPWLDANEIKKQVQIEPILEAYGQLAGLTRQGATLKGASPFCEGDESRFLSVNTERGVWNQMGGRPIIEGREVPGNVIGIVQALEGCGFREALEILSDRFVATRSPEERQADESRGAVGAALRQERVAQKSEGNEVFGKELKGLRFDVPWLQQTKGISVDTARAAGVGWCTRGMFKSRVVFPIKNASGTVVAYAGRSLKDDDPTGKWRVPPGFDQRQELFGIERVANDKETVEAVAERGIVVVKGFTDVLRLVQNGFPNTVALMGNEFGERQVDMLVDPALNPSRKISLFLDNDEAGNAAKRKLAGALIHRAYVRYANYRAVGGDHKTAPEQFTAEELAQVVGYWR